MTTPTSSRPLELEREFKVPVDRLFSAFTTPEALKAWWWPEGLYSDRIELEFREGGRYFINMKGFDQGGGGMTGRFEKIENNKRIFMSDQFADESGRPISAREAKMPGEWPDEITIAFDFESLGPDSSRLKLSQTGIPDEVQKDCIQGWEQMFDKLDGFLGGQKRSVA